MKTNLKTKFRRCGRRLWLSSHSQKGQVFALVAVGIVSLVAMGAFVVDAGSAYHAHRRAQAAADAAALAAAQMLPGNTSLATTTAQQMQTTDLPEGSMDTPTYSSTYASNDTVLVKVHTTSPSVFAKIFGISNLCTVTNDFCQATAKATVGSYTGWANNLAPWAIAQADITWGSTVQFKTQNAGNPGNFGGTQLPIIQYGCNLGTGGSDYRDLISNADQSCLVQVGDVLNSKTGNLAGPTLQGLQNRVVGGLNVIQNYCPAPPSCPILVQQTDGSYVLTTYQHPNLVVIPVVDHIGNGSSTYTVVGFAWFIIQKYDSKDVWGMFIGSEAPNASKCPTASDPNAACPVGAYNTLGFKVIQLTG